MAKVQDVVTTLGNAISEVWDGTDGVNIALDYAWQVKMHVQNWPWPDIDYSDLVDIEKEVSVDTPPYGLSLHIVDTMYQTHFAEVRQQHQSQENSDEIEPFAQQKEVMFYSDEQVLKIYFDYIVNMVQRMAQNENLSKEEACQLVVFNMLSIIDGSTVLPGCDLIVRPHQESVEHQTAHGLPFFKRTNLSKAGTEKLSTQLIEYFNQQQEVSS